MAQSTKEIKNRIKSVQITRKMTKAMEMIAASKMKRAIARVLASRPFSFESLKLLAHLVDTFSENEFVKQHNAVKDIKNVLVIVFAPERGFCGSFNSQLLKRLTCEVNDKEHLKTVRYKDHWFKSKRLDEEIETDFLIIGKKGEKMVKNLKGKIIAQYNDLNHLSKFNDIKPIAQLALEKFIKKEYQKVILVYTDFISTITRKAKMRQLLPVSKYDVKKTIAEITNVKASEIEKEIDALGKKEYLIEPNASTIIKTLAPRLVEMQIFHALLESKAAEESARMVAMKNASDSASKIVDQLKLKYNQIRQSKITQEISEISAGRSALEG
jgi:F-type H+-transporting ATPase subunit gamma